MERASINNNFKLAITLLYNTNLFKVYHFTTKINNWPNNFKQHFLLLDSRKTNYLFNIISIKNYA